MKKSPDSLFLPERSKTLIAALSQLPHLAVPPFFSQQIQRVLNPSKLALKVFGSPW